MNDNEGKRSVKYYIEDNRSIKEQVLEYFPVLYSPGFDINKRYNKGSFFIMSGLENKLREDYFKLLDNLTKDKSDKYSKLKEDAESYIEICRKNRKKTHDKYPLCETTYSTINTLHKHGIHFSETDLEYLFGGNEALKKIREEHGE